MTRQRHSRLALLAIMVLAGATVALVLSAPRRAGSIAGTSSSVSARPPGPRVSLASESPSSKALSPLLAHVSRGFLAGYLAYVYGHGSAAGIRDTSRALHDSLSTHTARVSSVIRARRPRVVSLTRVPAGHGTVAVCAVINDGSVVDYHLRLVIKAGRVPLVSSVAAGWQR